MKNIEKNTNDNIEKLLDGSPTIYEWSINVPPPIEVVLFIFFMWFAAILLGGIIAVDQDSLIPLLLGFVLGFIFSYYLRYLWMSNQIYHYQITPIGIRYTQQANIPDVAYTIVRVIAWTGIALCLLALFSIGPIAFVGASGMALMAFSLTNFNNKTDNDYFYFIDNYEISVFKKRNMFSLKSNPLKSYEFGYVHCEPNRMDQVLNKIFPYLKNYTIKEVTSSRHL